VGLGDPSFFSLLMLSLIWAGLAKVAFRSSASKALAKQYGLGENLPIVKVDIVQDRETTGTDSGFLVIEKGRVTFYGERSSFSFDTTAVHKRGLRELIAVHGPFLQVENGKNQFWIVFKATGKTAADRNGMIVSDLSKFLDAEPDGSENSYPPLELQKHKVPRPRQIRRAWAVGLAGLSILTALAIAFADTGNPAGVHLEIVTFMALTASVIETVRRSYIKKSKARLWKAMQKGLLPASEVAAQPMAIDSDPLPGLSSAVQPVVPDPAEVELNR
jgi:hypothetical protein